jgi:tetratricopeptide (TPR) repeat protein
MDRRQGWLLHEAAFRLRAMGRLEEAREPMRAGLEAAVALKNWVNAAISASTLSELELTLGDVASAVRDAKQCVQYAERSRDAFEIMSNRTTHADALHQAGRLAEAGERFREAETLQKKHDTQPLLYSLWGFRFCDFLLGKIERAAWLRSLRLDEQPLDAQILADIEHRAATALAVAMRYKDLLSVALDNLTLGRIALFRVIDNVAFDSAHSRVESAVHNLRQAGAMNHLPRALLARTWLRAVQGDPTAARADLDEAQQIAERGPMRLHLADVHLYRARLFFRENREEARAELSKARALIERCGYHRRDEELRDAEAVIL